MHFKKIQAHCGRLTIPSTVYEERRLVFTRFFTLSTINQPKGSFFELEGITVHHRISAIRGLFFGILHGDLIDGD